MFRRGTTRLAALNRQIAPRSELTGAVGYLRPLSDVVARVVLDGVSLQDWSSAPT